MTELHGCSDGDRRGAAGGAGAVGAAWRRCGSGLGVRGR